MGVALAAEGALVTVVVVEAEGALAGAEVEAEALEVVDEEAAAVAAAVVEEEEEVEASILAATGVVVGEEKEETSRGRM